MKLILYGVVSKNMQIRCMPLLQRIRLLQSEMANPDKGPEFHGVGEIRLENYSDSLSNHP